MAVDRGRAASRRLGGQLEGFRKFILRGNVVDLAVGIVIGAAFTSVVQALVKSLITPLIGVFGGIPDFSAWAFSINGSRFPIGDFVNALVSFLIISFVVYYFVVMPVNKLMDRYQPTAPLPAPTKECPECLSKIPKAARRCANCTIQLEPAAPEVSAAMQSVTAPPGS